MATHWTPTYPPYLNRWMSKRAGSIPPRAICARLWFTVLDALFGTLGNAPLLISFVRREESRTIYEMLHKARRPARSLAATIAALVCASAEAQHAAPASTVMQTPRNEAPVDEIAPGEHFQLKGERVCLPSRPEADGRILLDCAIGLRGDDERFYGLRAADRSLVQSFPKMNERVLVTGTFVPVAGGRWEIAGDIVYTSIHHTDEPKTVAGTLLCVDHEVPRTPPAAECRTVVQTTGGFFWGLESESLSRVASSQVLTPGAVIEMEGIIIDTPEGWEPWASLWAPRRIEGVLEVKSAKKVPTL